MHQQTPRTQQFHRNAKEGITLGEERWKAAESRYIVLIFTVDSGNLKAPHLPLSLKANTYKIDQF